jgi:hypothetical protein
MSNSKTIINMATDTYSRSALFKITVHDDEFDIRAHGLEDAISKVIQELTYQQVLGHPELGWKAKFDIHVECLGSSDPEGYA